VATKVVEEFVFFGVIFSSLEKNDKIFLEMQN
jgi:hypothetical protein